MYEGYLKNEEYRLNAVKYLYNGGYYDDALSRAYYSMFYAAKALLSVKEIYPKAHKGVISKFGLEFVKKGFIEDTYGRALNHAKDRKEVAEYDVEKENQQKWNRFNHWRCGKFFRKNKDINKWIKINK